MKISKNFNRSEFACKCGCGFDTVDYELLLILEEVRAHFDKPVTIESGCRSYDYNKEIGGSEKSQHLYGRAADFKVKGTKPMEVYIYLNNKYPNKLGLGLYRSWVHLDTRTNGPARWKNL